MVWLLCVRLVPHCQSLAPVPAGQAAQGQHACTVPLVRSNAAVHGTFNKTASPGSVLYTRMSSCTEKEGASRESKASEPEANSSVNSFLRVVRLPTRRGLLVALGSDMAEQEI